MTLPPRVVYTDVDGTLTRFGSLFRGEAGVTLEPARGLRDLHDASVEVVLVSGRARLQVLELATLLGCDAFVAEMGGLLVHGRGTRVETTVAPRSEDANPAAHLKRIGVPEALLEAFPEKLERHEPWFGLREVTLPFRGHVDVASAQTVLDGLEPGLRIVDNGSVSPDTGEDPQEMRIYHVLYDGVSKGRAVARDRERRGLAREDAVAVGNSAADLSMAPEVGAFYLVDASVATDEPNVHRTHRAYGDGFAEAVDAILER